MTYSRTVLSVAVIGPFGNQSASPMRIGTLMGTNCDFQIFVDGQLFSAAGGSVRYLRRRRSTAWRSTQGQRQFRSSTSAPTRDAASF